MIIVQAAERHEMFRQRDQKEPITGCTWCIVRCPECGYKVRICYETGRKVTMEDGDMIVGHYYDGGVQVGRIGVHGPDR